ncbi:MAG: DUF4065 domain-containing protein [Christensenellaceae bacterium]|nr:DUF4065 domain-containing protein [Christensenellaceae bacterium]
MTTWKLQKLCYYSQAWALVWSDGVPLFEEDFQAWRNGPVCRELYDAHKGLLTITAEDLKVGQSEHLNYDEKDTIEAVLRSYGHRTPLDLSERTHFETPWLKARNGLAEYEPCDHIITKDSMGEYYGSL